MSFTPAGYARNDLSADRQASMVVRFAFESDRTLAPSHGEMASVYYGVMLKKVSCSFLDADAIENKDYFVDCTINDLEYVQHDFFVFKNNSRLENRRETRTAGFSNLIIELCLI